MNYTSDDWSVEEATQKADLIVDARIIDLGARDAESIGLTYFRAAKIEVIAVDKGTVPSKELIVGFQVLSFNKNMELTLPKENAVYRFYIRIREDGNFLKASKITDI